MDKVQASVEKELLKHEKQVLKDIKATYNKALQDISERVEILQSNMTSFQSIDISAYDEKQLEIFNSQARSKIYQLEYQKMLEKQVSSIVEVLKQDTISNVHDFLNRIYQDSYLGVQYDINMKGIPITVPINPNKIVGVINKKIEDMTFADRINVNMNDFKKTIKSEISRGLANGSTYNEIARNLSMVTNEDLYKSTRIVRTECARVSTEAKLESIREMNKRGADLVKQWDSTLDNKTRVTHTKLDQQYVEVDEAFKVDGYEVMGPGMFGDPRQDCNCRCVLLSVPRWDLEDTAVKYDNEKKKLIEVKSYQEWKANYYNLINKSKLENIISYKILNTKEIDKFQEISNKCYNKLTSSEKEAMYEYTMGAYQDVNDYLNEKYEGFNGINDMIKDIDNSMSKYNLNTDIITFRGTNSNHYSNYKVGDIFSEKMYYSTSLNKNIAQTFADDKNNAIIVEIKVPKGTKSIYVGDNTNYEFEAELLLSRNLSYKVIEKSDKNIILEVVNEQRK